MWRRFSEEERQTIWDMREAGFPVKRIASIGPPERVGVEVHCRCRNRPTARERSELRLSPQEREEISRGLAAGDSIRAIAAALGRSASTVCREVNANGGRKKNRALVADRAACRRALRPTRVKLALSSPAAVGGRAHARGQVVTPADFGVVGSGVSRSPGDAGVPRDHLPVALRPVPWSAAQRAPIPACAPAEP